MNEFAFRDSTRFESFVEPVAQMSAPERERPTHIASVGVEDEGWEVVVGEAVRSTCSHWVPRSATGLSVRLPESEATENAETVAKISSMKLKDLHRTNELSNTHAQIPSPSYHAPRAHQQYHLPL